MEGKNKIKILKLTIKDHSDESNVNEQNYIIKRNGAFIGTEPEKGKDKSKIKNFNQRKLIKVSQKSENQDNFEVVSRLHLEIVYVPEENSYFIVDKSLSKFYYEVNQFQLLVGDELNFGMGNQIMVIQDIKRDFFDDQEYITLKLVLRNTLFSLDKKENYFVEYEYEFSKEGIQQVYIGRNKKFNNQINDIIIENDKHVSRQHGKIYINEDKQNVLEIEEKKNKLIQKDQQNEENIQEYKSQIIEENKKSIFNIFYRNLSKTNGTFLKRQIQQESLLNPNQPQQLQITELQKVYIGPNELTFNISWEDDNEEELNGYLIQNNYLCSICKNNTRDKVINCGHTFCSNCLMLNEQTNQQNNVQNTCPQCKKPITEQKYFDPDILR